jgi:hypothetical protein
MLTKEQKTEIGRKELAAKLGGRKFSLRKVSFSDLARDAAHTLTVAGVPDGIMSSAEYEANKEIIGTINQIKDAHLWKGGHIL